MKLPRLPKFTLSGINLINLVGAVIVVYLVVLLGETIKRNYDMGRDIDRLKSEIVLLQDQRDELNYNIQYYKTDSYRDREARSKLGLQLPGENVIIIPRTSTSPTPAPTTAQSAKNPRKSNLQQWLDFLAGRKI